jgi:GntR family transcriptional regulator
MAWNDTDLATGTTPLWAQLAERLRTGIHDGEFPEGANLPSETQLTERFQISRATARNALSRLATEGLVERRSGKGTRVLPPKVEIPLNRLSSFSDDMESRGLVPGYGDISASVEAANERVAAALDLDAGAEVIKLERTLLANAAPIAHSTSWLSPDVVPTATLEATALVAKHSLYQWLETQHNIRITHGTEVIEGGVADGALAADLNISPGSAVLNVLRTARTGSGDAVEYAERSYRADRYRYTVELVRS